MRRAVICLVLAVGRAFSQPVWIERSSERASPPLQVQVYRLTPEEWILFLQVNMETWLPYAFDTVVPVRMQVHTEEGLAAETLLSLPAQPIWSGAVRGHFPSTLAGQMTVITLSYSDAPTGPFQTRAYWQSGYTTHWIESVTVMLAPPVRIYSLSGESWLALPGDSLWQMVFSPAAVDTSLPELPFVIRRGRRPPLPVPCKCAWYMRGDSSVIFWTCEKPFPPYRLPVASRNTPRAEDWQEAHRLFSDRKPGERTDRGLVYLFYGQPPLRLYTPTQEVWVYPREGVSFHFVWEKGTWRLLRRMEYQGLWNRR